MVDNSLSERDVCTKFITPALERAGWDVQTQVREEVSLTAGKVLVRGKLVARGKSKRADYVLHAKPNLPLAVIEANTDGAHQPPPQVPSGIPFLTIGNVSSGRLEFTETRFVARSYFEKLDSRRVQSKGDILYTVVGATNGRPVLVDALREFCVQRHIAILRPDGSCDRSNLYLFLRSYLAYSQATRSITGTVQPTVPLRPLREFKIPLPPVTEQKRIVAKVEQLMAICNQLECALQRSEERASKLAEAVVGEMVA